MFAQPMHECCLLLNLDFWAFLDFLQMVWSPEAAAVGIYSGQGERVAQELHLPLPPTLWTAGSLSLPHSLFRASNRENSLPRKELTPCGHSLRPQPSMNPLPTLILTANGSQAFASLPLQGKLHVALNPGR